MYEKSMRVGIRADTEGANDRGRRRSRRPLLMYQHSPLLEPSARIELATFSLRVRCSTN